MFQSISEGAKKLFALIASFLWPEPPPEKLKFLIAGAPFAGKSATVDGTIGCLNDARFAASRKRLTIRPVKAAESRVPGRFPARTNDPTPYPMWLSTGRGTVQVEFGDYPGEYTAFLQTQDTGKDCGKAKQYREAVAAADGLVLVLSPGDLFEKGETEFRNLLARLLDLVNVAAANAHKAGRAFRVYVLFTKMEQYGEPGFGDPRLMTGRRQRRAFQALRAERPKADEALAAALSEDAGATADGLALRKRLIARALPLFTGLAMCRELDAAGVHAYFVQATATWPGGAVPWNRRGIPQLLEDLTTDIRDRYSRPLPYWAIGTAAALAVFGLVFATGAGASATDTKQFSNAYRDDQVPRIASQIGRPELLKKPEQFESERPWAPADQPGRLAFLMALNDAVARFSDRVSDTPGAPADGFQHLRKARAETLEWETAVWTHLKARERGAGGALREHGAALRELNALFAAAEADIDAVLISVSAVAADDTPNLYDAAAKFEGARARARGAIRNVRASELKARTYIRSGSGAVHERSVGDDVILPWCAKAEQLLDAAKRAVAGRVTDAAKNGSEAYRKWLLTRADADIEFLAQLAPELCRNPYSWGIGYRADVRWPEEWEWPAERIYAYIRVRELSGDPDRLTRTDLAALRTYDIDFETQEVYEVHSGERARQPLVRPRWSVRHGPLARPSALEVVGVWIKPKKNLEFQRVPLACRGDGTFWLPALLEHLKADRAALVGRPATTDPLHPEWRNLLGALAALLPPPETAPAPRVAGTRDDGERPRRDFP